jgi:hypothetical protein
MPAFSRRRRGECGHFHMLVPTTWQRSVRASRLKYSSHRIEASGVCRAFQERPLGFGKERTRYIDQLCHVPPSARLE